MPQFESRLDALKFEIQEESTAGTRIKVIGVGGGGTNAASRMYMDGIPGVEFYAVDTDKQALDKLSVPRKLLIAPRVTQGLGAGSDAVLGRDAAVEDTERLIEMLEGADMVFVAAGLGGGTGTGAAPVIAALAKEMNALTVAVVTKPFFFEGLRRKHAAEKGIEDLSATVDALIQVPNDRLISLVPHGTPLLDSFRYADDVLRQAVAGIAEIMNTPGLINRDFSDIRSMMKDMGRALIGTATASGENAPMEAAKKAIHCPLLEAGDLQGAGAILVNLSGSPKLALHEVNDACTLIREAAGNEDLQLNFGVVIDEKLTDQAKVTVIATGFNGRGAKEEQPKSLAAAAAAVSGSTLTPHRVASFTPPEPAAEPMPADSAQPMPVAEMEAEEEPDLSAEAEPEPEMAAVVHDEPVKVVDDLEVPAFLRRDRRMFG